MSETSPAKPAFLSYLHSFRGFAILNIVAVHAFAFAIWDFKSLTFIASEVLFHNSTIYFALISGLLYTTVLKTNGYQRFYISKFKFVVLPYLFFTLLYTVFDNKADAFFAYQTSLVNYLSDLPRNFLYGKAFFVLWYIPVLLFLYVITPLLDYIMQIKKLGPALMAIAVAIPLFVRREEIIELYKGDFLSIHNMVYFTGAYAAGMYLASNLKANLEKIGKYKILLLLLVVVSTATLAFVSLKEIDRVGLFSIQSSLYYVQKLAFSFLVLMWFNNMGQNQPKWLQPIATDAFAIYFLHALFLAIFIGWFGNFTLFQPIIKYNAVLGGVFVLVSSIASSMLVTRLLRRIFGRYSRMIVGS